MNPTDTEPMYEYENACFSDAASASTSKLLNDVLADVAKLAEQHLQLTRIEICEFTNRVKTLSTLVFWFGLFAVVGVFLLMISAAYALIIYAGLNAAQAFGVIALTALIPAAAIYIAMKKRIGQINGTSSEIADELKENIEWIRRKTLALQN